MQLDLPLAGPPVVLVRHRRARRYILRVLPDGTVRVTMPWRGARGEALAFLERSRAWVEGQQQARAQQARRSEWRAGGSVLIDGVREGLRLEPAGGTRFVLSLGEHQVGLVEGARAGDLRPAVERWLQQRARRELPGQLLALANQHAVTVTRISVRNQRSRWGACSGCGSITLNWRLLQVPPHVREYVLLHELMHTRELNHSRRFWRHVASVCPRYREARDWLLGEGQDLF